MIKLSDHFTYSRLLKFTISPIIMMVFTALYNVVDGFFISNYAGKIEFAAVNFIIPYLMALSTVGFMFGAGGSALIGKLLGEGKNKEANECFSLVVYSSFVLGLVLAVLSYFFLDQIVHLLGATDILLKDIRTYAIPLLISLPFFVIEMESLNLFMVAERPKLGLTLKLLCGGANIVLDAVFMGVLHMGVLGASLATMINQLLGGIIPVIYFSVRKNKSTLHLGYTPLNFKHLGKVTSNGSSELVGNLSGNIVGMLFNVQLLKYIGEDGVSAYGIIMYLCFLFNAMFFGFSSGSAPIISYHYGAKNTDELHNIVTKSLIIMSIASILMFILSESGARLLAHVFVGYDPSLMKITVHGFRIFSFAFLVMGWGIFLSSLFTALNNGPVSAFIAFLRTIVLQISTVMILPRFFGENGIWISPVIAEAIAMLVAVIFFISYKKKYNY